MSASTPRFIRVRWIRSTPLSILKGLVREEPRMVPPRGRMPRTAGMSRVLVRPSSGPRQPSRKPTNSYLYSGTPLRTIARITAFRPGQSPPPVSTPMRTARRLSRAGSVHQARLARKVLLDRVPPREVVPGVGQRVVRVLRRGRQRRSPGVLPALAQLPGEPGQRARQGGHRPPQLAEHHVVVGGDPGPQ